MEQVTVQEAIQVHFCRVSCDLDFVSPIMMTTPPLSLLVSPIMMMSADFPSSLHRSCC
jgi:hypothetical protein